ncbi:hypothetical protein D3C76_1417190 [compost metagenome]
MAGDPSGQFLGLVQRPLQAGRAEVGGGGIGFDAGQAHTEHGAQVAGEEWRLGDAPAQQGLLRGLADDAQRVELGAGGEGGETLPDTFEHGILPVPVNSQRARPKRWSARH